MWVCRSSRRVGNRCRSATDGLLQPGEEGGGTAEGKQGAERDLRRAWRNVAFAQYYDPDVQIGGEPQTKEPAQATPLQAGCVRIDSALGEIPPDIFGQAFAVDISARTRGGRRARGVSGARAAAAARGGRGGEEQRSRK